MSENLAENEKLQKLSKLTDTIRLSRYVLRKSFGFRPRPLREQIAEKLEALQQQSEVRAIKPREFLQGRMPLLDRLERLRSFRGLSENQPVDEKEAKIQGYLAEKEKEKLLQEIEEQEKLKKEQEERRRKQESLERAHQSMGVVL